MQSIPRKYPGSDGDSASRLTVFFRYTKSGASLYLFGVRTCPCLGAYGPIVLSNNLTILSAALRPLWGFVPVTIRSDVTE